MGTYAVQLESFEGPLDLLLQLIERNELDITEVSLAAVADQYIEYINAMKVSPEEIVDFLVVVSRLLYLKSKILLPNLVVEEDGIDLEKQLKLYRVFIETSKNIRKIVNKGKYAYIREKYPENAVEGFLPPKGITSAVLARVYSLILKKIEPVVELPKKMVKKAVSIYDKIRHIQELIKEGAQVHFSTIIEHAENKTEKIVSFLALLELVKQRSVVLNQENLFGEIIINKHHDGA